MASLRFERWYPHPPARVWQSLTDRELLARWLMPNDFSPQIGHRFTFQTDPAPGFDGIVHCEVLELEPLRRLVFSWKGGPLDTIVRFEIEPERDGTRLRMEQTGFRGVKAWLVSQLLKGGFRAMYTRKLPAVLDALAADEGGASGDGAVAREDGCMTRSQGVIARVLGWMEKK